MAKAESSKHKVIETSLMGTNEEKALCHSLFCLYPKKKEEEEPQKEMGDSYSTRESDNAKINTLRFFLD